MSTANVIARYLAIGGAQVVVERGGIERCPCINLTNRHNVVFVTACEACGHVFDGCVSHMFDDEDAAKAETMTAAQEHAASCRRIPERLWAKDGAR